MKTLRYAALALAVSGVFTLGAKAGDTTNDWWNVNFNALADCDLINQTEGPYGAMVVLTNTTIERDGREITHRTWEEGEWVTLDGDETIVTNSYFPTNTYKAFGQDTCLKLDTQGNDLTWTPAPTSTVSLLEGVKTLVDADLYLVGSDSAPDTGDFDAAGDVQTAIYLKNETDEDSGETTNSVLCVYAYDSDKKANYWQELKGVEMEDNAWFHVQVLVDHSLGTPMVRVYVNNTQMSARDGDTVAWTVANTDIAQAAKKVSSVSFRGTGAVDNFVGVAIETTYDQAFFKAEAFLNGSITNELCQVTDEKKNIGGETKVEFTGFKFDDYEAADDVEGIPEHPATYALTKIEIIDFANQRTRTYYFDYDGDDEDENGIYVSPREGSETTTDIFFEVDQEEGFQTGEFSVKAVTDGASVPADPNQPVSIVRIYFETLPEEGDFKLTATQNVGDAPADQKFNVNTLAVDETTFTFAQSLTDGGTSYILSTITVGATPAGIEAAVSGTDVVVTVPLSDQIAEGVYNVATATYVEGSLADGEELQGSRDGNVYTYTKYTPPVAIIIAGTVTNKYDSLRGAITNATAGDTIYLLRDDAASFTAENPILDIDIAVTIDGGSNTLYGLTDYAAGLHEIRIGGSGNVTIKDLKMTEFGDTAPLSGSQMPIVTRSTYTGTLTLDGVTIDKFNRQALLLCGGNFLITNSVITGDTTKTSYFQSAIETYYAKGTVVDTTISGIGALDAGTNGEGDAWAAAVFTVNPLAGADGTITVKSGSYTGQFITAFNPGTIGAITLEGGTFVATVEAAEEAFLDDSEGGSTLAISGGWFDREPDAKYLGALSAYEDAANAPNPAATWTVGVRYTITFNDADGTPIATTNVAAGATDYAPADPVPALVGIKFAGWTNALDSADAKVYTSTTMPAATGNATYAAKYDPLVLEPIAVDPGTSLTAADKTNGDLPIEVTNAGFVVKFRSSQPNIVYQLVASDTINPADWTACPAVGDPVTSAADTSEQKTQLITLTAPMTDNVKFFKIKASVPAGN